MGDEVLANVLPAGKCGSCGSEIKYASTVHVWFRKFVTRSVCRYSDCVSRTICLICKSSINLYESCYPILYFKHILGHYGLNVDYSHCFKSGYYNLDGLYFEISDVYNHVRQLLFICVEEPIKNRGLTVRDIRDDIKNKVSSCLICKQSGVDTFYESFPTLEVIVSHLMKVHVDQSIVVAGLPSLIDIIRDVDFD